MVAAAILNCDKCQYIGGKLWQRLQDGLHVVKSVSDDYKLVYKLALV